VSRLDWESRQLSRLLHPEGDLWLCVPVSRRVCPEQQLAPLSAASLPLYINRWLRWTNAR